jgi:membrane protein DedA with SNARE-associated domain
LRQKDHDAASDRPYRRAAPLRTIRTVSPQPCRRAPPPSQSDRHRTEAVVLSVDSALQAARSLLDGMGSPAAVALALALSTLLLEDLAIAAGVALATEGVIPWTWSFAAVSAGIAAGDVGLYAFGLAATRVPLLKRHFVGAPSERARSRLERRLATAVLLARVIPGLRFATYTVCGFVRVPLLPFTAWVLLAVTLWTTGLYAASVALGQAITHTLGVPSAVAVALPIVVLAAVVALLRRTRQRSDRDTP